MPGKPVEEWPTYYIDAETCIDCGACVPVCPTNSIFPNEEVPADKVAFIEKRYFRNKRLM